MGFIVSFAVGCIYFSIAWLMILIFDGPEWFPWVMFICAFFHSHLHQILVEATNHIGSIIQNHGKRIK